MRRKSTAQSGFVLLLMTALLSLAGGAMLAQQHTRIAAEAGIERAIAARQALTEARSGLLAYAADYAELYGPTGAGPGHLPCPDTDEADDPALDGPNPPCGGTPWALGALPRHVTPGRQRHAFHDQPDQGIRYEVNTAYVNNPLNRLVNARGALHAFESAVMPSMASLAMPVARRLGSLNASGHTRIDITEQSLLRAARPAVLQWLIIRANARLAQDCSSASACTEDQWKAANLGSPGDDGSNAIGSINGVQLVPWLADPDTGLIDSVPAIRHWFVRNRWYEDVLVRISSQCRSGWPGGFTCRFQSGSQQAQTLPMIIELREAP